MIKTPSFYNEPYFFCSSNHMKLANPRIRFGVIGGPIGGHLGKPVIIIECKEPQLPSNPQYTAPAPEKLKDPPIKSNPQYIVPAPEKLKGPPPGLQKQLLNTPQPLQSTYRPPPPVMNVPVFRPYVYPNFQYRVFY
uniref:Uncharacterized protein n=1 Tax=viral metagenome TaxID=1070528 RepID=A0A6C0HVI1_9ZZZZ